MPVNGQATIERGRTRELDVDRIKLAILRYSAAADVDSAAFIQALAEITGMTAALLDRDAGVQSFDERMAAFTDHARQIYRRGPPPKLKTG